jgi:predicted RNase H-like HicB family nuclease
LRLRLPGLTGNIEWMMREIIFTIEPCHETGGYVARWDDLPGRGGITTQGDSFAELQLMVADAVKGYFEPADRPARVRMHFVEDPIVSLV